MMWGNATLTDESNGTTSVPSPTTKTPNPGCLSANPPDRIIWFRSGRWRGVWLTAPGQTVFFSVGEALKRTVLPAFTLMDSPVRGLRPFRAFVFRTVNVPKLGRVNLPLFFSSLTMASIRSPAARFAAAPVSSTDSLRTWERTALDLEDFLVM